MSVIENPFDHRNKLLYHGQHVENIINGKRPFPIHLEIDLTNICNHACSFCNMAETLATDKSIINTNTLLARLDEAKKLGAKSISFTGGGEPTMHPDFERISTECKKIGYDLGLVTNGSLLIKNKAKVVAENYNWVRISLGGPNQLIYAKVQGKDDFGKVMDNMNALKSHETSNHLDLGIKVMLIPENIKSLEDLAVELANHQLSGKQISYIQMVPNEYTSDGGDFVKSQGVKIALEKFEHQLEALNIPLRHSYFTVINEDRDLSLSPKCYAHYFQMVITATGEMTFCRNTRSTPALHVGNIYKKTFAEIWESDQLKSLEESVNASNCNTFCRSLTLINLVHSIKNPAAGYSRNFF